MRCKRISLIPGVLLTVALCLGLAGTAAAASPSLSNLTYQASTAAGGAAIHVQKVEGAAYLFLPSSADLHQLALTFDGSAITMAAGGNKLAVSSGAPFDLTALYPSAPANGVYAVTLSRGSQRLQLNIMVSSGLRSLYLTSADPAKDRDWVEQNKENKAKGQAVLLRADGTTVYDGALTQIKGRGNSTWGYPKKPYQIKLEKKTDLLETGDTQEAAKTWVLLANYIDESLIHNSLSYDLAAELDLAYSPHSAPVDLYYDGEYRGSYLLCEKTEVGEGRVNVADLEGAFEDANPDVEDFDDLATQTGKNAYGNLYQYVTGLTTPEDFSGGYLLELDFSARAKEEKSYFTTSNGQYVVSKSPEYLSAEAIEYISAFYQEFEDAVWNGGVNPTTGKLYSDYVDVESLAKCYLILELSQDGDAFQSSTYFYKPAGEEKLYAGPVWDFDSSYGTYYENFPIDALVAGRKPLGQKLLTIPSFREAVQQCYEEELYGYITQIALSQDPAAQGEYLCSLAGYGAEVAASQKLDHVLWPQTTSGNYAQTVKELQNYLSQRNQWLYQTVLGWQEIPVSATFYDISPADWFATSVNYVVEEGLFAGTSPTSFSPYETMTRAMAVTVLYRLAGEPQVTETAQLSDVEPNSWYSQAVAWGLETGVVEGLPDGTFHPNDQVTRQEMVAFLYRYAQDQGLDTAAPAIPETYTDRTEVESWATEAFAWAIHEGILTGTKPTLLEPQGSALRCQAATMFQRFDGVLQGDAEFLVA